jgi:hypothetical protein
MTRHRALFVLLAIAGLGVASCVGRRDVTAPSANVAATPSQQLLLSRVLDLLACAPEPYDSVVQTVGPQGGTIHAGAHTLMIPAGALASNTTITAVVPADPLAAIRFKPEGLAFARAASLTMSYAACPLANVLAPVWVVYADDAWSILEVEPSMPDPFAHTVTGRIRHFSGYAVAY